MYCESLILNKPFMEFIMKQPHIVKLVGCRVVDSKFVPCNTGEAEMVERFIGSTDKSESYFRVIPCLDGINYNLQTPKGTYVLTRNKAQNIHQANINGIKIQVSIKKIVGELRYWA
jgi:hypothetical protein